jgi:hypothetical protein
MQPLFGVLSLCLSRACLGKGAFSEWNGAEKGAFSDLNLKDQMARVIIAGPAAIEIVRFLQ